MLVEIKAFRISSTSPSVFELLVTTCKIWFNYAPEKSKIVLQALRLLQAKPTMFFNIKVKGTRSLCVSWCRWLQRKRVIVFLPAPVFFYLDAADPNIFIISVSWCQRRAFTLFFWLIINGDQNKSKFLMEINILRKTIF